jgi:hypothetical protein
MATFEVVALVELKTRLPAKLLPLVEEYREKLEELTANQGARLTLEKGDDPNQGRGRGAQWAGPVPVSRGGRDRELLS